MARNASERSIAPGVAIVDRERRARGPTLHAATVPHPPRIHEVPCGNCPTRDRSTQPDRVSRRRGIRANEFASSTNGKTRLRGLGGSYSPRRRTLPADEPSGFNRAGTRRLHHLALWRRGEKGQARHRITARIHRYEHQRVALGRRRDGRITRSSVTPGCRLR